MRLQIERQAVSGLEDHARRPYLYVQGHDLARSKRLELIMAVIGPIGK